MIVREARSEDETEWRKLWLGYTEFYRVQIPEDVTAATWRRALDPSSSMFARLAEIDGTIAGFCMCVVHDNSWSTRPDCYLEDLFVAPHARRGGVGAALIEDVLTLGRRNEWRRVYWHTQVTNEVARRLYDRLTGGSDNFVRYTCPRAS